LVKAKTVRNSKKTQKRPKLTNDYQLAEPATAKFLQQSRQDKNTHQLIKPDDTENK